MPEANGTELEKHRDQRKRYVKAGNMESIAHVLIVFYISVSQQGASQALRGVSMQEFSSAATCQRALELLQSTDRSLYAHCLRK